MSYFRYFILCSGVLFSFYFGSTWHLVFQVFLLIVCGVLDLHTFAVKRFEQQYEIEEKLRLEYVRQLNPHKWKKE